MTTNKFETGATTHEANNFILAADNTQRFANEMRGLQQIVWLHAHVNRLPHQATEAVRFAMLRLINEFDKPKYTFVNSKLTDAEKEEVVTLYISEAIKSIESDLF